MSKMKLKAVREIVKIKQVVNERDEYFGYKIISPDDGAHVIQKEIADDDREVFLVLALNTKNELNAIHRCHVGSINASIVHVREVFKVAFFNNASSILVGHNHPSGKSQPSREDIEVTKRLAEAGKILGIELLDHIIVGTNEFTSLKEKGYL